MFYSVFLDGNTWNDSHSVNRELWTGEWRVGAALVLRFVELGFEFVEGTREFEEQAKSHSYGSVFLKANF